MDERDRPANDLLYDTEAALRLVDKALDEICAGASEEPSDGSPDHAALAQASLALVRRSEPVPSALPPAIAAELSDILEDVRLGRALLERARTRRPVLYQEEPSAEATVAIGSQYVSGAAHLLGELEQRVARLVEMLARG